MRGLRGRRVKAVKEGTLIATVDIAATTNTGYCTTTRGGGQVLFFARFNLVDEHDAKNKTPAPLQGSQFAPFFRPLKGLPGENSYHSFTIPFRYCRERTYKVYSIAYNRIHSSAARAQRIIHRIGLFLELHIYLEGGYRLAFTAHMNILPQIAN